MYKHFSIWRNLFHFFFRPGHFWSKRVGFLRPPAFSLGLFPSLWIASAPPTRRGSSWLMEPWIHSGVHVGPFEAPKLRRFFRKSHHFLLRNLVSLMLLFKVSQIYWLLLDCEFFLKKQIYPTNQPFQILPKKTRIRPSRIQIRIPSIVVAHGFQPNVSAVGFVAGWNPWKRHDLVGLMTFLYLESFGSRFRLRGPRRYGLAT